MKLFTKKLLFLLSPIIISFMSLEITLRVIPDDYKFKANYLKSHASEIETLILGSSHSFFGINPVFMKPHTFNASHVSQSLDYDCEILMNTDYQWENLEKIYIPISYFSMWSRLHLGSEPWRCKLYYQSYSINNHLTFKDYLRITADKFSTNIMKSKVFIINNKDNISCNKLGWGYNYKSENRKDLAFTGTKSAKRHTKDLDRSDLLLVYKENISNLNEVVSWANKRGAKVVFFTPPAYKTYRVNLNDKQLNLTITTVSDIANKYKNCTYINLMANTQFKKIDFYDADHLNEIGAEKLSKILTKL